MEETGKGGEQRMWHAPLSARQLAGRTEIGDVQLLRNVVRVHDQVVLVLAPVLVLLFLRGLTRTLGGLLFLELSALRA
jgi:hypothetical protein